MKGFLRCAMVGREDLRDLTLNKFRASRSGIKLTLYIFQKCRSMNFKALYVTVKCWVGQYKEKREELLIS